MAALVTYLLLFAALVNLIDGRPIQLTQPHGLAVLSDVDRSGASLSGRERGLPFYRRGLVHLPDLFVVTPRPFPGPVSAVDLELEIPEDSWFDVLLGSAPQRRTLIRLSRRGGQSFVASVPADESQPPSEQPLPVDGRCLEGFTTLLVERQEGVARIHAGDCQPIAVEDPPGSDASISLASGLGGATLRGLRVRESTRSENWHSVLTPSRTAVRLLRAVGIALVAVLVVAIFDRRRASQPRQPRPRRAISVWSLLAVAAIPTSPFIVSATVFLLAFLLWLHSRSSAHPTVHTPSRLTAAFLGIAALSTFPALVASRFSPTALSGERMAIHATPDRHDVKARDFPAAAWGVALEIEPPRQGGFRVSWGEQPLDGEPLEPPVYPDLFSMSPFVLLERRGDNVSWLLGLGDVVLQTGEVAATSPVQVVHRRATVVLSQAGHVLARYGGVPARRGDLRFLPIVGRLDARADLMPQPISPFEEVYLGLGPQIFLLAVLTLAAVAGGAVLRPLRRVTGLALTAALLVVGFVIGGAAPPQTIAASWNLLPALIVLACVYAAVRHPFRRGFGSPAAWAGTFLLLLVPNALLPIVGGPAAKRFTRPWYARIVSPGVLPHLDPDGRMFNDTAISGRYHGQAVDPDPPAGKRRIVVLGGSQTYGEGFAGTRPPQIWTTLLEERLDGVEVVNLAVQGSTLSAQVERLRGLLQTERTVHGVIAVFGMNDGTLLRRSRSEVERIALVRNGTPSWRVDPCAHIAVCNVVRKLRSSLALFSGRGTGTEAERTRTVATAIEELVQLGVEHHLDLRLVREPQQCDLTDCQGRLASYAYPHGFDMARSTLDNLEGGAAAVLEVRSAMRPQRSRLPFFDLVHFSAEGHRIMAQLLAASGMGPAGGGR